MREIVHMQAGQCGNQIGAKVTILFLFCFVVFRFLESFPRRFTFEVWQFREFFKECRQIL